MQYLGDMSRCWMFTALASGMIVALNYHNITDSTPRSEIEKNIHACVQQCYYFDKTLSLLLLRPPSLPSLKVRPTQLMHIDPDLPTSTMIIGMVEYSELKSALLNILLDTKAIEDTEKANILSDLVARAHTIHSNMQMVGENENQNSRETTTLTRSLVSSSPRTAIPTIMDPPAARVAINGLQLLLCSHDHNPSSLLRTKVPPRL